MKKIGCYWMVLMLNVFVASVFYMVLRDPNLTFVEELVFSFLYHSMLFAIVIAALLFKKITEEHD